MSKRKFNLGDILRKLNEDTDTVEGNADQRTLSHKTRTSPSTPSSPEGSVAKTTAPKSSDPSEGTLPVQPVIGRSTASFDQPPASREPKHTAPVGSSKAASASGSVPVPPNNNRSQSMPVDAVGGTSGRSPQVPPQEPTIVPPPPSSLSSDDDDDDEEAFDIHKYVSILFRRKYIILLVVVISALFSLFRFLRSDSYYVASARLLFQPDAQEIINDQRMFRYWGDREKMFSTHLELLKSLTVLTLVADNMGEECTASLIEGGLTIQQGETNGEQNDIIELSFRHSDPEFARDVLNELCRTYIEYRRDVNAQEITRLVSKFEFQIEKVQADLTEKETALRRFKEANRMVELSNETNVTISKLADMEMALQQTQLELLESKERLMALNKQIGRQELNIVQSVTFQDPFRNRIAELELELNTLTSEYSPEHFKVKTLRQQIDNLKSATADSVTREAASKTLVKNPIRQTLLQDLVNLTIEKSALEAKRMAQEQLIERLNTDLVKLPSLEQQYAFLQRETESLLQTLRMLKGKYEEAKIRRDSEESDLKLLELARTPQRALSSVKKNSVILGLLVGLILGISLALLIEYLDQSLKDPSAVEKNLGVPLLGIVPYIEADNALIEQFADLTKNLLEPFRALRANIKHIATANNLQVFIVCSAVKGEGKTTLAANLGITFAVDGKKVILVDADLRRSQAHTLFAIPKEMGLSDYLIGSATIDQIIKPTRFENMAVVTSGERPQNPAELLGTPLFDRLIAELRTKADIVIFDSPALLPVSDTITMAPKMDGVLFVVRTFWTPLKAAKQALNQLQRIESRIYGGILNGASHSGKYYPYYYGYYGYYGYYSYKYSYEDDHDRKKPFSVRRAGLHIEKSAKEKLRSLRYSIPKVTSHWNRGVVQLAKRKSFWFLLLLLLAVTSARMAVKVNRPQPVVEPILYLGLTDGISHGGSRPGSGKLPASTDMAFPAMPDVASEAPMAGSAPKQEKREQSQDSVLTQQVHAWFNAFSRENIEEYLSYYDRGAFHFNGGGFAQWEEQCHRLFANDGSDSVELEEIRMTGRDDFSVEVYADYTLVTQHDSIPGRMAALWKKTSGGWRIVRQKRIARHAEQKREGR